MKHMPELAMVASACTTSAQLSLGSSGVLWRRLNGYCFFIDIFWIMDWLVALAAGKWVPVGEWVPWVTGSGSGSG